MVWCRGLIWRLKLNCNSSSRRSNTSSGLCWHQAHMVHIHTHGQNIINSFHFLPVFQLYSFRDCFATLLHCPGGHQTCDSSPLDSQAAEITDIRHNIQPSRFFFPLWIFHMALSSRIWTYHSLGKRNIVSKGRCPEDTENQLLARAYKQASSADPC